MWSFSWSLIGRPTNFVVHGHFGMLLFGCFVWALLAEHYKVTSVEELFRERTGARAVCAACLATSVILLAILYFSRKADFPRGLFVSSMLALLILAVFLRAAFRVLFRSRSDLARPTQLLPGCRHRPVCVGCFPAPAAAFLRTLPRGGLCALAGPGNRGRKLPRV